MKAHYEAFYAARARDYDALVAREDHAKNLDRALAEIPGLPGGAVVECGAGTGRVTAILAALAREVRAFDREPAMLRVAEARLAGRPSVRLAVADHRALPIEDAWADAAVEGWSFGHLVEDAPEEAWRAPLDAALDELARVVRPGGALVLIETMGTGRDTPSPPSARLAEMFDHLAARGFARRVIRTDYAFADLDEAVTLAGAFFGAAMAAQIRERGRAVLPEHTGIFVRRRA